MFFKYLGLGDKMLTGLISNSLRKAVGVHQYFLGTRNRPETSFDDALKDFITNHLVPWVESNPDAEYVEIGKQNLVESCIHLGDLNLHQIEALKKAIADDQWFLGEKNHHSIDAQEAEKDFYRNYLRDWAMKFRTGYCFHICEDRGSCKIAEAYRKSAFEFESF